MRYFRRIPRLYSWLPSGLGMTDRPRLFLITPAVSQAAGFSPLLETAVAAADVACVLLRLAGRDAGAAKAIVRELAPIAQARGTAVLVEDDARLAVRAGTDGVHITGAGPALAEAIAALRPDRIVGAGGLVDRDAAMRAGEAGVDYVMFGGPDTHEHPDDVLERTRWWAEVFNVPCVAYAPRLEFVGALAETGAEFVALGEDLWNAPDDLATTLAAAERMLTFLDEGVP